MVSSGLRTYGAKQIIMPEEVPVKLNSLKQIIVDNLMSTCFAQDGSLGGKVIFVAHELSGLTWIVSLL